MMRIPAIQKKVVNPEIREEVKSVEQIEEHEISYLTEQKTCEDGGGEFRVGDVGLQDETCRVPCRMPDIFTYDATPK